MFYLECNDFDDLYNQVSRLPINKEKELEDCNFKVGSTYYINNLILKTNSCDCSLDLGEFNYTLMKWKVLVNKYIDKDDYILLKQRLIDSTSKTLTFNFKIHIGLKTDLDKTKNRDSCIIAIVFSRNGNKGKWEKATVLWRVAEIYKKFACDLILLNRMFNDLPNLEIKEFILHIVQPFFSSFILSEIIDSKMFSIEEFKNSESFVGQILYSHYLRYYGPEANLSNYHAIRRKQEMKKSGKKLPSIPIDTLKIFD